MKTDFGIFSYKKVWFGLFNNIPTFFYNHNHFKCSIAFFFNFTYLFVYNHYFCTQLYDIKYSHLIQIICTHLYGFKYSCLIWIIWTLLHDFKYSSQTLIIYTQLYSFNRLIYFISMSTCLGLFYALRLGNHVYFRFILTLFD